MTKLSNRGSGAWSEDEDRILYNGIMACISKNQPADYVEIARSIPTGRTAKQARERWQNALEPSTKKGIWSDMETLLLLDLVMKFGQEWSIIRSNLNRSSPFLRSLQSVKSKGISLLGEENRKRKKSNKHVVLFSKEEFSRLKSLHRKYGSDFKRINEELKSFWSEARIERELLRKCRCKSCKTKAKGVLDANGNVIITLWSKEKAKRLKSELELQLAAKTEHVQQTRENNSELKSIPDIPKKKNNPSSCVKIISKKRKHVDHGKIIKDESKRQKIDVKFETLHSISEKVKLLCGYHQVSAPRQLNLPVTALDYTNQLLAHQNQIFSSTNYLSQVTPNMYSSTQFPNHSPLSCTKSMPEPIIQNILPIPLQHMDNTLYQTTGPINYYNNVKLSTLNNYCIAGGFSKC
eukprot:CAMPEP_0204829210 /NCGR_PEP_ID=MMETSP1346-20131115/7283_1 /ASSEMBLY_ACC=CAM_ASM_000771 /TAXON_ID=215587 /ORGANISM="Aplanochytrium stocchinoi, Strain GSBS06" /LENGTH=406 /DNA_ID=CAMNT_0051958809 /DNA_START=58 /DNA_END=1275 /DNA_ORIENTATION=+